MKKQMKERDGEREVDPFLGTKDLRINLQIILIKVACENPEGVQVT